MELKLRQEKMKLKKQIIIFIIILRRSKRPTENATQYINQT